MYCEATRLDDAQGRTPRDRSATARRRRPTSRDRWNPQNPYADLAFGFVAGVVGAVIAAVTPASELDLGLAGICWAIGGLIVVGALARIPGWHRGTR